MRLDADALSWHAIGARSYQVALSSAAAIGARDMNAESMTKLHVAYSDISRTAISDLPIPIRRIGS